MILLGQIADITVGEKVTYTPVVGPLDQRVLLQNALEEN